MKYLSLWRMKISFMGRIHLTEKEARKAAAKVMSLRAHKKESSTSASGSRFYMHIYATIHAYMDFYSFPVARKSDINVRMVHKEMEALLCL